VTRHEQLDRRERILLAIGCGVMLVWGIAVLVQVAAPSHPVPDSVSIVTPIVATGLFGSAWLTNRTNRKNGTSSLDEEG
jgi:hypothetical protein